MRGGRRRGPTAALDPQVFYTASAVGWPGSGTFDLILLDQSAAGGS